MIPVWFDSCFGWLHLPPAAAPVRASGVVLCSPVGFEKQATHRAWRLLAVRLAERGFPVLRFDYPASGNSGGDEADPALIDAWVGSIAAARRELVALTGVGSVAFCGLHLGALLAMQAVAASPDIEPSAMVLLAPQSSGRSMIRTWTLIANVTDSNVERSPVGAGGVEAAGLRLSAGAVARLKALDMRRLGRLPGCDVLLLDDPAQPSPASTAATLETAGLRVERDLFSDLSLVMQDADRSQPPEATWSRVVDWLMARIPLATGPLAEPPSPRDLALADGTVEQVVTFGPSRAIGFYAQNPGVRPATSAGLAVLFSNTGCNPQFGPGRVSVHLARALAAAGVASLRIDLPGIGESALPDERARPHIYTTDETATFRAAVDLLVARGHDRVVGFGTCSGAYHAMRAAQADHRIRDLVLVNQVVYEWSHRPLLSAARRGLRNLARRRHAEASQDSLAALFDAQTAKTRRLWQKMRRIGFHLATAMRSMGVLARLGIQPRGLARLAAQGVRILVVVGENDPSRTLLHGTFGVHARRLLAAGDARLTSSAAFDHSLASATARETLSPELAAFLGLPLRA